VLFVRGKYLQTKLMFLLTQKESVVARTQVEHLLTVRVVRPLPMANTLAYLAAASVTKIPHELKCLSPTGLSFLHPSEALISCSPRVS
jgi:hypothetical protein